MNDLTKKQRLDTVEDVLLSKFTLLLDFGYEYVGRKVETSKLVGRTTLFIFSFPAKNMEIIFAYGPEKDSKFFDHMSVSIVSGKIKTFLLSNYFKSRNIHNDKQYFNLDTYQGDFKNKLDEFCNFILKTIESDLESIIKGEKWEEVPFDWHGYK